MKIQKQIEVRLMKRAQTTSLRVVQYDTGVQLIFNILDFDLPDGTTATFYARKKSGKFVYQESGITVSGNTVTVDLENQALTEHGTVNYQLRLVNGSDVVSTFCSEMLVDASLADADAEESKTVIAAFEALTQEQIAEIQAATLVEIAKLQQESQDQQNAIVDKGVEVLATIPADYTETSDTAKTAIRTKADAIICSAEGDAIVIEDSANDPLRGLKLFGKTTQKTTTGKQLFDSGAIGSNLYTSVDENGIITIDCDNSDGESSKYATFYTPVSELLSESTTYAVILEVFSASGLGENVYLTSHYTDELSQFDDTASITTLTVGTHIKLAKTLDSFESSKYMCRGFMTIPAATHVKASIRVSVLADTTVTASSFTYEPYTGGAASPSPDYPQDINSVENPVVSVFGKNLLQIDNTDKTQNGITFKVNDDGSVTCNGTATDVALFNMLTIYELPVQFRSGEKYIASGATESVTIQVYDWQEKWVHRLSTSGEGVFTISEKATGLLVRFVINAGVTVNNFTVYPMIRRTTVTDASFESYKAPQELEITTPNSLPGVRAKYAEFANHTDSEGNIWTVDTVDFERGLHIQRVKKIEFTGDEEWADSSSYPAYTLALSPQSITGMCSHLKCLTVSQLQAGEQGIYMEWSGYAIAQVKEYFATLAEFKAFLAEQYANGTPFTILYSMESPVETALTAAEIEAFKAISTNYPNTTILNDAGAWMVAKYNADLELFIADYVEKNTPLKSTTITMYADKWVSDGLKYSQVVTMNGVTPNSKIDLQPSPDQLSDLVTEEVSLTTANDGGVITVYAIGNAPSSDITMQALITEVVEV